jgi:hypothetical protein
MLARPRPPLAQPDNQLSIYEFAWHESGNHAPVQSTGGIMIRIVKGVLVALAALIAVPANAVDFSFNNKSGVSFDFASMGYMGTLNWTNLSNSGVDYTVSIAGTMNGDGRYGCDNPTSPPIWCFPKPLTTLTASFTNQKNVEHSMPFVIGGTMAGTYGTITFALNGPGTVHIRDFGVEGSGLLLLSNPIHAPEPATWAMMIGGFGMVGGMMRSARRKRKVVATYS